MISHSDLCVSSLRVMGFLLSWETPELHLEPSGSSSGTHFPCHTVLPHCHSSCLTTHCTVNLPAETTEVFQSFTPVLATFYCCRSLLQQLRAILQFPRSRSLHALYHDIFWLVPNLITWVISILLEFPKAEAIWQNISVPCLYLLLSHLRFTPAFFLFLLCSYCFGWIFMAGKGTE